MNTDIAVIGGGLAGAAMAVHMAGRGRQVLLIEREVGPHDKVCGEFLSREALLHLRALDIDPAALGGHAIGRVRLSAGGAVAEADLPFQGLGLSRRVLDEVLLDKAREAGAALLRGRRVQALEPHGDGHRLRLEDGRLIAAAHAVLATGKHDLRGWKRGPGRQNDLVGFKLHLRLTPEQRRILDGHVELALFRGGYAGLQMVEQGQATLCLLIRRSRLAELGGAWSDVLRAAGAEAPLLARRLGGSEAVQARPLSIAGIPYGFMGRPDEAPGAGVWRLGDQSTVIPSFTGDGMSIALHGAALAATLLGEGARPSTLQAAMRRDVGARVAGAAALSLCLVRRPLQPVAVAAVRLLPTLASAIAAATRVPDAALRRSGVLEGRLGSAQTRQRPRPLETDL